MKILPAGRTDVASGGGGRGKRAATEVASQCLPKAEAPEEHGGMERSQSFELRSLKEFQQAVQQDLMRERIAAMAPFIRSNAHLRRIINKIPIKQREAVYNALKAHLRFTPQSFAMLKPR